MVRVPEYQRTEQLRGAFRQGIDVRATPEAFGSSVGAGMQGLGRGVGQVGEAINAVQEFDNENDARDAATKYSDWLRENAHGEGGYFSSEGKNAVEGYRPFQEQAEAKRKEFAAGLKSGASRLYDRSSQALMRSMFEQAISHQERGRKSYFRETSDAERTNFANNALAGYKDPKVVNQFLTAGLTNLDERGRMEGWSPDELTRQRGMFTSGLYGGVATRMMDDDPIAADAYLAANADKILPGDMLKLRNQLEAPLRTARTSQTVDAFMNGLPAPDWSGGSGGGYDVVLGHGKYGQPPKPITEMPIGEVISFGKNVLIPNSKAAGVGRDDRGLLGSSAVGRYQITQSTLQRYAPQVLGADWQSQPFTADVQDKIAEAIFNDSKGLGSGMSKVWASLSPAQAERVSKMPWSQAKNIIAAGESGGGGKAGNDPNAWLAGMYAKAAAIPDAEDREAAYAEIDRRFNRQQRVVNAAREQAVEAIEKRIIADPNFDPKTLPVSVQQVIGLSGMSALQSHHDAKLRDGKIKTDPVVMDQLLQEAAFDPDGFSRKDLLPYRDRLSDSDFMELRGKQRGAAADLGKALRDGSVYKEAYTAAGDIYDAAGIGKGFAKNSDALRQSKAAFNGAMRQEVDEFVAREKRKPSYDEMRGIASALTLKVIGSETRRDYSPMRLIDDAQDDVWTGRAFQRGDVPKGTNLRPDVSFTDVPAEWVAPIRQSLQKRNGKAPTNADIAKEWGSIAMSLIGR